MANQKKTIILWGREDVLGKAVEHFLTSLEGWEVIRISGDQKMEVLAREVEKTNPDVVILYVGDYGRDIDYLPMQLVQNCPGMKLITVSLENNSVEVYNKQLVQVQEVSDLLSVISE